MEGAWRWISASASGWLTPAGLFVLLNLVIGTIAVTSRAAHRRRDDRPAGDSSSGEGGARPPLSRAPSSVLERLRSFGIYRFPSGDLPLDYVIPAAAAAAAQDAAEPGPDPSAENVSDAAAAEAEERHHFERSRSESRPPAAAEVEVEVEGRMKKSASASSAFAKFEEVRAARRRAAAVEEEEVNARADDFINRFRQQLKLQRLNSLLNYKEMLNRG